MNNGTFIMLEGTDGSGKATQTERLVTRLQTEGFDVETISFPQYGTPSATMVEAYLNGELGTAEEVGPYRASILYAVDRYAAAPTIRRWLAEGKIVIANRYVASNMGHQGGKIVDAAERKRYFDWNYDLEYNIFEIPKPDINIILHVTPEISQQLVDQKEDRAYIKGKKRDIHEDDLNHLRHAEAAYLDIAREYPEFHLIECTENSTMKSIEAIHSEVWEYLQTKLSR